MCWIADVLQVACLSPGMGPSAGDERNRHEGGWAEGHGALVHAFPKGGLAEPTEGTEHPRSSRDSALGRAGDRLCVVVEVEDASDGRAVRLGGVEHARLSDTRRDAFEHGLAELGGRERERS